MNKNEGTIFLYYDAPEGWTTEDIFKHMEEALMGLVWPEIQILEIEQRKPQECDSSNG